MQNNKDTSLRETLEQLSADELRSKMMQELKEETPDADLIRLMLSILEDREMGKVQEVEDPQTEKAWKIYQKRVRTGLPKPKKFLLKRWIGLAAAIALAAMFLIPMLPQKVEASRLWEFLNQWTSSVVEFFSSREAVRGVESDFKTDHEGMQQIYDAALELGIDEPLIPKWFEESYIISQWKTTQTPNTTGFAVELVSASLVAAFNVDVYSEETYHGYCRDEEYQYQFEENGTEYKITHNIDKWIAIWRKDNVEYFLAIDCSEDVLWKITESIYKAEETK